MAKVTRLNAHFLVPYLSLLAIALAGTSHLKTWHVWHRVALSLATYAKSLESSRPTPHTLIVWMGWELTTLPVWGSINLSVPSVNDNINSLQSGLSRPPVDNWTMQRLTALELFSLVRDSSLSWIDPKDRTLTCIPALGSSVVLLIRWPDCYSFLLSVLPPNSPKNPEHCATGW